MANRKEEIVAKGVREGLIPIDIGDGGIIMVNCKACGETLEKLAAIFGECSDAPHGALGKATRKEGLDAQLEAFQNLAIFLVSKMAAVGAGPEAIKLLVAKAIEMVGHRHERYDSSEDDKAEEACELTVGPGGWKRMAPKGKG